ncbi:MAG: lipid A biosynthesis acyltransferase [Planctomycetaceae bacterium]|nr:MAG: lipid A biosynthesis acyltransferase [Planctomycetaceae bacterium]
MAVKTVNDVMAVVSYRLRRLFLEQTTFADSFSPRTHALLFLSGEKACIFLLFVHDMAKNRNKYLDYIAYLGMRLFAMFVHMFDHKTNYRTAALIGNLLYRFDKRHRKRALEHLRLSFPDWSDEKRRQVARASMRNLVYLGLEVLFTTRLITPGRWRRHITLTDMSETIRLLLERESGVIMLTGHFGNWEVVGYMMATLGFPTVSIARRLDNLYIDKYVFGIRQNTGQMILDKRGATTAAPEVLENKGVVGFIADQDAGKKGAFVDFFGRKASTYKSIALLAIQYNAPVIIGFGRRLDEDYHFEIGIQRLIRPEEWADKDDPVMWITQEYTTALENVVRRAPEQYLWVHRRWKHRPKGEEPGPDGVA